MKSGIYLLKLGNLLLLVVTILAWCAPYEFVQDTMIIPILGLTYPAFILVHGVFVIFWVLMRSKWAFLSFLAIVTGQVWHPQVLNWGFTSADQSSDMISVANLNAQFLVGNTANGNRSQELVELLNVDILCLQESNANTKVDILKYVDFPHVLEDDASTVSILSKYPILAEGQLGDPSNPVNVIKWANILIGVDTIRLYCGHLESNRIDGEIPKKVVIVEEEEINFGAYFGILKHYSKFSKYRIRQAQEIQEDLSRQPYPVIVCGDMNDNPMSRMYKIMNSGMQDTWYTGGFGFGKTFDTWVPGMRIDHIFVSGDWQVSDYKINAVSFSDHHIVRTALKLK